MAKTLNVPGFGICTVTAETTLQNGGVKLTLRTPKGKTHYIMASDLPPRLQLAPAASLDDLVAEHRAEHKALLRRMRID